MAFIFTDDNYKAEIEKGLPVVIDIWAEWCGPCKAISPIVEQLATEYDGRVLIGKYDADEGMDLPAEFGVRGIPTLLFFKGGNATEPVDSHTGSITADALRTKIDALI